MPPAPSTRLQVDTVDDVTVALVMESVLVEPALLNAVRDEIYALAETKKPRKLVLNLSKLHRCSTEFFANLLGVKSRLKSVGGIVKISNVAPDLMRHLKHIKFEQFFEFFDDEQAAVDSF